METEQNHSSILNITNIDQANFFIWIESLFEQLPKGTYSSNPSYPRWIFFSYSSSQQHKIHSNDQVSSLMTHILSLLYLQIIRELFIVLKVEINLQTRKIISKMIGKAAGLLLSMNNEDRERRFIRSSIYAVQSNHFIDMSVNCYYILEGFVEASPQRFGEVSKIVKQGLNSQNSRHNIEAMKVILYYLKYEIKKKSKKFCDLALDIYEAAKALLYRDQDSTGLQMLRKMIDICSIFFEPHILELANLVRYLLQNTSRQDVKIIGIQCLIEVSNSCSQDYVKKSGILKDLMKSYVYRMVQIGECMTEEWLNNQGDDDLWHDKLSEHVSKANQAIDRTINFIEPQQIFPFLTNLIYDLLQNEHWKYKFAALMTISQMGEYIDEHSQLPIEMRKIIEFLQSEIPQIRFAACQAISQLCNNTKIVFQIGEEIDAFSELIKIVKNDHLARVVRCAVTAITNFINGMPFEQILKLSKELFPVLIDFITKGASVVKYYSFRLISTIFMAAPRYYRRYVDQTLEVLFSIFSNPSRSQIVWRQHKLACIEALTVIGENVEISLFKPLLDQVIQIVLDVQASILYDPDFPDIEYVFSAWHRLCISYPEVLKPLIIDFFPNVLFLAERLIQRSKQRKYKNSTTQLHDCTTTAGAFLRLVEAIYEMKGEIYPYMHKVFYIISKLTHIGDNTDIVYSSCNKISTIITQVDMTNMYFLRVSKQLAKDLLEEIRNATNWEIITPYIYTLLKICSIPSLFTKAQLRNFLENWAKSLRSFESISDSQRYRIRYDSQQVEQISSDKFKQQAVQCSTTLLNILFMANKGIVMEMAESIIVNIVSKVFRFRKNENLLLYGLSLVDALIETCEYPLLKNHWESFGLLLVGFSQGGSFLLRGVACRAIGTLVEKTPMVFMNQQTIQDWFEFFFEQNSRLDDQQFIGSYRQFYHQNMIVAVGRILRAHHFSFELKNYFEQWLDHLPLRITHPKANEQIQILIDIARNHRQMILGNNQVENFKKILIIYTRVIRLDDDTGSIFDKIRLHILELQMDVQINQIMDQAWNQLRQRHRTTLQDFMNQTQ